MVSYAIAQQIVPPKISHAGVSSVFCTAAHAMTAPHPKATPRTACGSGTTRFAKG